MTPWQRIESKILSWPAAADTADLWRSQKQSIVFTNGCFDLLHFGHIHYLAEAKALGNKMIIGLNASTSVSRLKGPQRPIKDEQSRAHLLAAMDCVDAVVLFEEDTPRALIELLRPDVLVKGGDWQPHQIVGSDLVLANGGEVHSLEFVAGYSSTALVERCQKL